MIYHQGCLDGLAAAWCFSRMPAEVEFIPGTYQKPPPALRDRIIFLVDFSYKLDVIKELLAAGNTVTLLDHHASAIEELRSIQNETAFMMQRSTTLKSGAIIAWEYCNYGVPPPALLLHIQDRDLWQFRMQHTVEICEALYTLWPSFEEFTALVEGGNNAIQGLFEKGSLLVTKQKRNVESVLRACTRYIEFEGDQIPIVNAPHFLASDIGNELAIAHPFSITYYDTKDGRKYSLRSSKCNPDARDVSKIAEKFGGGGHPNAAGFLKGADNDSVCLSGEKTTGSFQE